ncbi:12927_t:CDS:2, partial [Dentiscutata heterogama]
KHNCNQTEFNLLYSSSEDVHHEETQMNMRIVYGYLAAIIIHLASLPVGCGLFNSHFRAWWSVTSSNSLPYM